MVATDNNNMHESPPPAAAATTTKASTNNSSIDADADANNRGGDRTRTRPRAFRWVLIAGCSSAMKKPLLTKIHVLLLLLLLARLYAEFSNVSSLKRDQQHHHRSLPPSPQPHHQQREETVTIGRGDAANANTAAILPTCQELMKRPHSPFADGSFLSRSSSTPVVWKMRYDGSRELTLPLTCRVKRYTSEEAAMCLKNENVLFVGDSLSRYQYLSLAYFLEHDEYPPRFQALGEQPCKHVNEYGNETCSDPNEPNVCAEGDWNRFGGWDTYIRALGGGGTDDGDDDGGGGPFRGRMESQTVRDDERGKFPENMRYVMSPPSRAALSFVGERGWSNQNQSPISGWKFTGCARNASCRYTADQYETNINRSKTDDYDWNFATIEEAFEPSSGGSSSNNNNNNNNNGTNTNVFLQQHADTNYVIYNRGLWGKLEEDKAKTLMKLFYQLTEGAAAAAAASNDNNKNGEQQEEEEDNDHNRCFFKSTTGCGRTIKDGLREWEDGGPIREAAFAAGCEFFDAGHLTGEFAHELFAHPKPPRNVMREYSTIFWDAVHYQPWVYEELNNLLLNVLCNRKV